MLCDCGYAGRGRSAGEGLLRLSANRGACVLLAVLFLSAGCEKLPTYRYKVTVKVDTPRGPRTGSSIIEIGGRLEPKLLPDMAGASLKVRGEAAIIELPNGRLLFALLGATSTGASPLLLQRRLLTPQEQSLPYAEFGRVLAHAHRSTSLDPKDYPLLVTFSDLRRPETIQVVTPDGVSVVSPGARIVAVTIATTEELVPRHTVTSKLPWLKQAINLPVEDRGSRIVLTNSDFIQ
jgi:hypothetical protein